MVEPHSIGGRKQEIRDLVANGEVGEAIRKLMDFVRDFSRNEDHLDEITVVSADHRALEAENRRNPMPYSRLAKERQKIVYKALALMRVVADEMVSQP